MEIPKASAVLRVTRGRPFSNGLLFVNGKYVPPPYTVERWGVGIRVNGIPVVSQVIDWTEFVKTQDNVKMTKTETPVPDAPAAAESAPEPASEPVVSTAATAAATSLDDLFCDEPQKSASAKSPKPRPAPRPRKPTVTVSYELEGDFVANAASRALVARINEFRTDLDRKLRAGGFICCGDGYSQVSGDERTAEQLLERLPDLQQRITSEEAFVSAVRAAGLVYLTEPICRDLFRNRIDYRSLQERRAKWKKDREWKRMLNSVETTPLF